MAVSLQKIEERNYELDCRGYVCPYPQLYTKKAMEKLQPGDVLTVIIDNPSSAETIHSLCKKERHKITESNKSSGIFRIRIEKVSGK